MLQKSTTMELHELRVLTKVVQAGSFTRAAELLGSDKARLSRTLSGLERKLKLQLLQRSTRALHLTEAGREVYERALNILAAVEDTERMAAEQGAAPSGSLKLTCGVEFGMLRVNGWIKGYLHAHPQVSVEVEYTNRLVDMVHEGFDLAIRIGPLQDSGLSARKLLTLHYGLYASPAYLARRGTPQTPAELGPQHDLLLFTAGSHRSSWTLHDGGASTRVTGNGRLRLNNSLGVCDAAVAGLGIAHLPLIVAQPWLANGALVRVLPAWQGEPVPVHAVFPSSRYLAPKVRAFIDHALADAADPIPNASPAAP